jgi:iron(III) transport system permease protein
MRTGWKTWTLVAALLAFFGVFLFWPLWSVLASAVWRPTGPTLYWITQALDPTNQFTMRCMLNALVLAVLTTIAATLLALPLAYLQARTEFRGKRLFSAAVLAPMILPPFVGAVGLKQVLGPYGSLNAALAQLGLMDAAHPVDWFIQYPLAGIVVLQTLHLFPILYLNVVAGLSNIDPSLEDAARSTGAGPWRVFRQITFPLAMPTYFAGATIVFIWGLTDLGTPLIFNFRDVMAVQIFDQVSRPSSPDANALVVVMLGMVALVYLGARSLYGKRGFEMMSVATRAPTPVRLGRGGSLVAWLLFGGVTLLAVVPHLAVILFSLKTEWHRTVFPSGLTLDHHLSILTDPRWAKLALPSIWNSVLYSLGAVVVAAVLAVFVGYILTRTRIAGRAILDTIVMLPLALPGIVLAFGYLNCYADWGDSFVRAGLWDINYLYPQVSPTLLLVVAYAVRRVPLMTRSAVAGFQQTSRTLEEAALSVGAGPVRTLARITVPLIAANLAAGAILVFAMSMLEVSDSLILAQSDEFNPITRTIFRIFSSEYSVTAESVACALGVWAMVFLALTLLGASSLMGKRLGAIFRAG